MTTSEDVKTLFRRFGGQPETYQEVVREDLAEHSLGKWPMLGQVNLQKIEFIPAAKQIIKTVATRPYSESLAVAQAGQLAVADYVASHKYVEPPRAPAPEVAPPYVPPRQETIKTRVEPSPRPSIEPAAYIATPAHAPVAQSPIAAIQGVHVAGPTAVRVSTLPPAPAPAPRSAAQMAPIENPSPVTRAEPVVSGLAARFRAQAAPAPSPQAPEPPSQSLHGLFGRLAQSQAKAQGAVGLLKRKLIT